MAPSKDECVIRDVKLRRGQLGPVLVNFEHGQLKRGVAAELKCGVYTPDDRSSICTIAAVAQEGDVLYQGDVRQDDGNICRTFLAVRNKRNNKMRIYEASHAMLSPSVGSSFVDHLDVQDKKVANYNLSHAFGSKKAKRVADQRARMEVNVDSVKEKLSTTVKDIEVTENDLASVGDDSLTTLLPPCFREAKAPADVYPINGLLKNKELASLESFYRSAVESEEFDTSEMSPFFKHMVKKIASDNTRSMAILLYAESLVKFCNLHPKQIAQKGTTYCQYSDSVHKRILKEFTTVHSNNISRSQFLTDKAVMYIIILSLHITAYQLDLDIVAKAITRLDMNRIKMLARIIGTVPSKDSGAPKSLVILKTPLPPPQSLIIKSRRSR